MVTWLTCTHCGARVPAGIEVENVALRGFTGSNAMAIAYSCPNCGEPINVLPDGDGTYSTIGGRIRKVADYVSRASAEELTSLRAELLAARRANDLAAARSALVSAGANEGLTAREERIWLLIGLLLALLAIVIPMKASQQQQPVTPEQIVQIYDQLERQRSEQPTWEPRRTAPKEKVGQNRLCPCGSGRKFKRCHGAHPTLGSN